MTKRNELGHAEHFGRVEILPDEIEAVREILRWWYGLVGRNVTTWNAPVEALLERLRDA